MIKRLPLFCYQSVSAIALTLFLVNTGQAAEILQPRAEVNIRAGTERSILMTEFWAPLAQDSGRVLYGDLRLMGDNDDNKEGNLGFGYRQINPKFNSVLGANAWIDRRRTERGNNFHQITLGVESLGETIDLRANAYIQLNSSKTMITPNIGSTTPYLAGSGIFIDTNGFVVEEPQDGFDAEIGYRLPIFQKQIDATRIYAGGYYFMGDTTDNVTGFRLRTEAQVNSIFSVGARFQHDGPRGSQGFLEATLRFPFSAKRSFQEHGLASRLDESPERDIDIVTGSKTDNGLAKEIINTTSGQVQRVLHVDNTAGAGGDGSVEKPFNTLAAAQTVLRDNDVLYVHRGDGSTIGQNQGIVINKNNVQMIGSGSDFVYDTDRFTTRRPGPAGTNGSLILAATNAPVITNVQAFVDDGIGPVTSFTGNGILVTGSNANITGVTVTGTSGSGIYVLADGPGISYDTITISNVVTNNNNNGRGILVYARNGATISKVDITNSISNNNSGTTGRGIEVRAQTADSKIVNANVSNNTTIGGVQGIYIIAKATGRIDNMAIENNIVTNTTLQGGIQTQVDGGFNTTTLIRNNTTNNNVASGIYVIANNAGTISDLNISNNNSNINTRDGIIVATVDGYINSTKIYNNATSNNTLRGIYLESSGTLSQNNIIVDRNTMTNNVRNGLHIFAQNSASLSISASENTITANGTGSVNPNFYYGVLIDNDSTGTFITDLGGGSLGTFGRNRIYGNFYREVFVDSRPGTISTTPGVTISARNNWWGINTGLDQGTRASFDNGSATPGSSIDSSNHQITDPAI